MDHNASLDHRSDGSNAPGPEDRDWVPSPRAYSTHHFPFVSLRNKSSTPTALLIQEPFSRLLCLPAVSPTPRTAGTDPSLTERLDRHVWTSLSALESSLELLL